MVDGRWSVVGQPDGWTIAANHSGTAIRNMCSWVAWVVWCFRWKCRQFEPKRRRSNAGIKCCRVKNCWLDFNCHWPLGTEKQWTCRRNSSHKQKAPCNARWLWEIPPDQRRTPFEGGYVYICCVWKSKAASGSSSYYHKICRDNACATRNPMQIRFSGLADTFTDTDTTERYCPVRPCSGWPVHLGAPHERVVKHQVFGG